MTSAISIVVPTLNRTELLFETLSSISAQSCPDWECVLIDDGSSYEHVLAIKKWISSDDRFRLLKRTVQPAGAPACRNIGWKASQHNLILFLDSDDVLANDCVADRLLVSKEYSDVAFWVFETLLFDRKIDDSSILLNVWTREDPISRFLKMDVIWQSSGVLWKKSTLEQLGGWDEALLSWQDWDLSIRALHTREKFAYTSKVDNYFRVRSLDRLSIGRDSFNSQHLTCHEGLVGKTSSYLYSQPLYFRAVNYIYFWIATRWVINGNFKKAIEVWKQAKPNFPWITYHSNRFLLLLLSIPLLGISVRKFCVICGHPGLAYWRGTYKRVLRKSDRPIQTYLYPGD